MVSGSHENAMHLHRSRPFAADNFVPGADFSCLFLLEPAPTDASASSACVGSSYRTRPRPAQLHRHVQLQITSKEPGSRTTHDPITHPHPKPRIRLHSRPVKAARPAGAEQITHLVSAQASESRASRGVRQCTGPAYPSPRRLEDAGTLRAQK